MRILVLAAMALLAGPALAQPAGGPAGGPAAPAQAPAAAEGALTPAQRREVLEILREALRADPSILSEALRENPLILRDAFEALRDLDQRDREGAARAAIAQHGDALFRDPADPVRGNPNGTVTLVEFFDVRCPYCKQLHGVMNELVRRNPDVRVVLKDLPVLGPNSVLGARALLAAQRQGRYEALHAALMRLREDPTEAVLRREAERAGIDWARLRREMDDPAIQARLSANRRLAEALRIEGTPALVVGETLIPGAVDLATLERLVGEQREQQARREPPARRGG
jgi:protein-disulfide isomerase